MIGTPVSLAVIVARPFLGLQNVSQGAGHKKQPSQECVFAEIKQRLSKQIDLKTWLGFILNAFFKHQRQQNS